MNQNIAIGLHLAMLREQAKLKQNELAKRLSWSAAVLSRVENGERSLAEEELDIVLNGIGTPAALKVKEILSRTWKIVPKPLLNDPEADLLWEAEQTAQKVHALAASQDVKQFYSNRLNRYKEEIVDAAGLVANRRYRAAFIGTIAVGKSTAICRAAGLEISTGQGLSKPVLETGAGGITICDVHLRKGPGFGLIVEPCTEDEIRRHALDFARYLVGAAQAVPQLLDIEAEGGAPGISREVERALRNMAGLKRKRALKDANGLVVVAAVDEARELAANVSDPKKLAIEILARMELHKRDRRDMWHSETSGKQPLEWLQALFSDVNNGRQAEFSLPKRIEMVLPSALMGEENVEITLIDTQGVDDNAGRADLEQHFDDPFSLIILCTVFNEAPATAVRQLLERAKDGGVRTLDSHVAILALPRPGEALAMKDNGYPAQSAAEGYELKAEEVQLKLHPLGLANLPLKFFNATEDPPDALGSFILDRINAIRESQRSSLREIVSGATALLENYEHDQAREAMVSASRRLRTWLDNNRELQGIQSQKVHDCLVGTVISAHPKTVYAAVARDGDWHKLNFSHELSQGARRIATSMAAPKLNDFKAIANNLLQDDQCSDAYDLIRQTVRAMETGFDNMIRRAQLVGQSIYSDEMKGDAQHWHMCVEQWGLGNGYRAQVNKLNRVWFEDTHGEEGESRVLNAIKDTWDETLASVRQLLAQE